MKIEREYDDAYRRWSLEIDPWVERGIIATAFTLAAGGIGPTLLRVIVELLGK